MHLVSEIAHPSFALRYESVSGGLFRKDQCQLLTDHSSNHVVYEALLNGRHVALKEYRTDPRSLQRVYKEALPLLKQAHGVLVSCLEPQAPNLVAISRFYTETNERLRAGSA